MDRELSVAGGLTGALLGVAAEIALEELTGVELVNGLLSLIGAGFGLLRIDRRIYESAVSLLRRVPVEPSTEYRDMLDEIDRMTLDLPDLRGHFVKLVEAGIRAQQA